MPTYEYQCEPCRIVYETMHGMNDPPIERCPKCDGSVLRLMSAPSPTFATRPRFQKFCSLLMSKKPGAPRGQLAGTG
jgi:putative FmdB family regulatory protein